MSPSITSLLMPLFIPSIFLLFSAPNTIATTPPSSLIQLACSSGYEGYDTKLCIRALQSDPKIVSAINLFDLSIRIMERGISDATKTRSYIENMMKKKELAAELRSVLKECIMSYDHVIVSLNSAFVEVKDYKEYDIATYDLLIASTDNIGVCQNAVGSNEIKIEVILRGNKMVQIFGLAAYQVVDSLSHTNLRI